MPKHDPNTGRYLPKNKRSAAMRTAASSIGRIFRGNPASARWTMAKIRSRNAAAGYYFFSRETMRFFGPETFSGPYEGTGGIFFVKSGRKTGHKVCQFKPSTGAVEVVWDLDDLVSLEAARAEAKRLAGPRIRQNPGRTAKRRAAKSAKRKTTRAPKRRTAKRRTRR